MLGDGKIIAWKMKLIEFVITRLFLTAAVFLFVGHQQALAQPHNEDSTLISKHRPGMFWYLTGWRPARTEKLRKYDRLIFDVTYNTLLDPKMIKTRTFASIGWNVNTMWDIPLTRGNTVSLGLGLAYKHQKVGMYGMVQSDTTGNYSLFYRDSILPTTSKYRFGTHQLAIPIELRFRQNKWNHVKFHMGGSIGYRLTTYQKWKDANGDIQRNRDLNDVNPWVVSVHARLGIRNWALYSAYSFSPHFKDSKSTKIQGLTFGVSISLF